MICLKLLRLKLAISMNQLECRLLFLIAKLKSESFDMNKCEFANIIWQYTCDKHLEIRCLEYLRCTLPYKGNVVISRLKMHKSVDMTFFMNETCVVTN